MAGRYLHGSPHDLLQDASAVVEIVTGTDRPNHGDQVAGLLRRRGTAFELFEPRLLAPARRGPTEELRRLEGMRPALEARAAMLEAVRRFFTGRGFLEVETPVRVSNPGLEPHLVAFPAGTDESGAGQYLITSPELHLKRFLAAGYEKVFEIARAFRDDERGALHVPEFALLEWYRTHAGLDELAVDLQGLVATCAATAGLAAGAPVAGCDVSAPFERTTYREIFQRLAGADPDAIEPDERERRFVAEVEPHLGIERALLLTEFPADAAALARLVPASDGGTEPVAARMELYVAGVELANGFDELTDPDEQRRRHEADRAARRGAAAEVPPMDEGFLAALEAGVPPSAGMALGLDRLLMVLLDKQTVADVRAFGWTGTGGTER